MLFSVIYSADFPKDLSVDSVAPPKRRKWDLTESGESECGIPGWRHRKWAAILTREEFEAFIDQCDLVASDTETMGAIGAPGFGIGWSPAVSFDYDGYECSANAYVTPVPQVKGEPCIEGLGRHCDAVLAAVRSYYGSNGTRWRR